MTTAKNENCYLVGHEPLVRGIKIWWGDSTRGDFSWWGISKFLASGERTAPSLQ